MNKPSPAELTLGKSQREYQTGALIYNGASTATGDPEALVEILDSHGLDYQLATSEEMNAMSLEDFSKFGVIIWPGGYAGYMSESLLPSTRALIKQAVREQGVGYVGICAGAFMAISPPALLGEEGPAWGLSLIPGDILPYYHLEDKGVEHSLITVESANHSYHTMLWWGGPTLPESPHGVITRYSDTDEPAITQTWAGKGLVLLAGPHPESPEEWPAKLGLTDPDPVNRDITWGMVKAALTQQPMTTLD